MSAKVNVYGSITTAEGRDAWERERARCVADVYMRGEFGYGDPRERLRVLRHLRDAVDLNIAGEEARLEKEPVGA